METKGLPQLHTIATVGERLSMSRSALWREVKEGRLKAVKIGRSLRVSETEIVRFINALEEGAK